VREVRGCHGEEFVHQEGVLEGYLHDFRAVDFDAFGPVQGCGDCCSGPVVQKLQVEHCKFC